MTLNDFMLGSMDKIWNAAQRAYDAIICAADLEPTNHALQKSVLNIRAMRGKYACAVSAARAIAADGQTSNDIYSLCKEAAQLASDIVRCAEEAASLRFYLSEMIVFQKVKIELAARKQGLETVYKMITTKKS